MNNLRLNFTGITKSAPYKDLAMHKLKNSFIRNMIPNSLNKSYQHYEHNLIMDDFPEEETSLILKLLSLKQQINIDDRNILRRILLNKFGQQILKAVNHDNFYGSLEYRRFRAGSQISNPESKMFYMVLEGSVKFKNSRVSKTVQKNEYYGHQEIMSSQKISSIKFFRSTSCLLLTQNSFNEYLKQYFTESILKKKKLIEKHLDFLYDCDLFTCVNCLLNSKQIVLRPKTKISIKTQSVLYIYFVLRGTLKSHQDEYVHKHRIIGLRQILDNMKEYMHTLICDSECQFIRIPVDIFKRCANTAYIRTKLHLKQYSAEKRQEPPIQFKLRRAKILLPIKRLDAKSLEKQKKHRHTTSEHTQRLVNEVFFLEDKHEINFRTQRKLKKMKTEWLQSFDRDEKTDLSFQQNIFTD